VTVEYFNGMSPRELEREAPPPARLGLDLLLALYPNAQIDGIDGQSEVFMRDAADGVAFRDKGPWMRVWLDGEEFAIWKETGAVYRTLVDGSVEDDPFLQPRRQA
jgi:hypothetical protein